MICTRFLKNGGFVIFFTALGFLPLRLEAQQSLAFFSDGSAFIEDLAHAIQTISGPTLEAKTQNLVTIFEQRIALKTLVARVTGVYARDFAEADLDRLRQIALSFLSREFDNLLKSGYDPRRIVIDINGAKTRGDLSIVFSKLIIKDRNINVQVDWRVKKDPRAPQGFYIEDVMVSGISYIQILKIHVESLLKETAGDVRKAIDLLEKKVDAI